MHERAQEEVAEEEEHEEEDGGYHQCFFSVLRRTLRQKNVGVMVSRNSPCPQYWQRHP